MGKYDSQRPPAQLLQEANDFIEQIRPTVTGQNRQQDYIIKNGTKTINICKSTTDTIRMTCAMTVTASAYCIFKGDEFRRTSFQYAE